MKIKDIELTEGNHFVAMEYYWGILNQTFLVYITDHFLIGLKMRGLISSGMSTDPLTKLIVSPLVISDGLNNPYSYINWKTFNKYKDFELTSEEIIRSNRANFKIRLSDIESVHYDKRKKWGMGEYPHDGKVYVETRESKKEMIILGQQSGKEIEKWILSSKLKR